MAVLSSFIKARSRPMRYMTLAFDTLVVTLIFAVFG
jgi:hypothetical protein